MSKQSKLETRMTIILLGIIACVWGYDASIKVSQNPTTPIPTIIGYTKHWVEDEWTNNHTARRLFDDVGRALLITTEEALNDLVKWATQVAGIEFESDRVSEKIFDWNEAIPGNWVKLKEYNKVRNKRALDQEDMYWGQYVQINRAFDERGFITTGTDKETWVVEYSSIDTSYPVIGTHKS